MRREAGARRGEQLFLHSMICFRLSVANSDTHMAYAISVCSHSQSWEAQIFEYESSSWYFSLFPFEFEPSRRVCRRRWLQCAGEETNRRWMSFFMNARCSCGKDMKTGLFPCLRLHDRWDGLTNIYHLLVLFMILQSKFEQKEIWARKKRTRTKLRMEILCQQTAGEKWECCISRRLCLRFLRLHRQDENDF